MFWKNGLLFSQKLSVSFSHTVVSYMSDSTVHLLYGQSTKEGLESRTRQNIRGGGGGGEEESNTLLVQNPTWSIFFVPHSLLTRFSKVIPLILT